MHTQDTLQQYGLGLGATQPQFGQSILGQPAFGSSIFGQPQQQGWGQQRQLSPQDIGEVVRQIVPLLPHILAQAQTQQPFQAAYGQRQLTPYDVNEVVRQILPVIPQVVGLLQGIPATVGLRPSASLWAGGVSEPAAAEQSVPAE